MFSKLTVNSAVFLGLTAFTVGAAMYFRNPLLVYTAIFLVTANIVLYIWAQYSVRGLEIKRFSPHLAVASFSSQIRIALTNNTTSNRYAILGFDMHRGVSSGEDYSPVAYLEAPPHVTVESNYELIPKKRGVYQLGPFYLYGGDPFGFYKCWRKVEASTDFTVLPLPVNFAYKNPSSISNLAQDELETVSVAGTSTEFLGVREYIQGEPLKHVHWPSTARLGQLISRQYEMNVAASVSVLLLAGEGMNQGSEMHNPLEYSLSMIAGIGSATNIDRFQLNYLQIMEDSHVSHSGTGQQSYQELAVKLASAEISGEIDPDQINRKILAYLPAGSMLLVFAPDGGEEMYRWLEHLTMSYRNVTLITFDERSFARRVPPERPGPSVSYQSGVLVSRLFYKDNLSHVLTQLFMNLRVKDGA